MHILAFANQKGGVGKTTCCVNVASALSAIGRKVLLIDLDPQGNATQSSGVNKNKVLHTVNEVLLEDISVTEALISPSPAGYDLLASNSNLTAAEVALLKSGARERSLKLAIAKLKNRYNYVVIDCPPTLNMLTINALVSATGVIIPMQCEYFALEGLSSLINTVEGIQNTLNKELQIAGIVRTMYDPRNKLCIDVSNQLEEHFKNKVYREIIPRNVRLAEAPSHGMPIIKYDQQSRGATAYMSLVGEIVMQHEGQTKKGRRKIYEEEIA